MPALVKAEANVREAQVVSIDKRYDQQIDASECLALVQRHGVNNDCARAAREQQEDFALV